MSSVWLSYVSVKWASSTWTSNSSRQLRSELEEQLSHLVGYYPPLRRPRSMPCHAVTYITREITNFRYYDRRYGVGAPECIAADRLATSNWARTRCSISLQ